MDTKKDIKDEILFRAEKLLHYNNLLITQCNSWLSEEEGMKNMEKRIREKERAKKKGKRKSMLLKIYRVFRMKSQS